MKERKIFLDELPRGGVGIASNKINWKNSVGCQIKFIYDDIEGYIYILEYITGKNPKLKIKYEDEEYVITVSKILECKLKRILKKKITNFKIEIGTIFQDDKRNLIITDRENRKDKDGNNMQWYKYTCNKCGWTEGWMIKSNLLNQYTGCSCCFGRTVVEGINDIPTTAPWMIPYFQGGYEEAKKYTCNSGKKIYPICPDCGRIKKNKITINNIYKIQVKCSCGDNTPYPEKLMFAVLEQLGIDFQTQLTKTTFKWCDKYRYDFYFEYNNEQYIIETHGLQHYEKQKRKNAKTLEEEQENDRVKKELAIKNGIKEENYIVVDCRYSKLEFIKQNILNSRLNELFDLSSIDWLKAEEFTCTNLVKTACEYKRNNPNWTTEKIGNIMGHSGVTIRNWLLKGVKLGWCNYSGKEEIRKKHSGKPVEIFKNGISLGIFESIADLSRQSERLFGIKLDGGNISKAYNGKRKDLKGFIFKLPNTGSEVMSID